MARKSRALRMSQTCSLIEGYSDSGLKKDYRYRFLTDVLTKLESGRPLSTKQRSWLDSLIEEGVPQVVGDPGMVQKIRDAIGLKGMEHRKHVLEDFLGRVSLGRDLSPKQSDFLAGMLKEAENIKVNGPYSPSGEVERELEQCILLSKSYSPVYWETHPGTARALRNVSDWIQNKDDATIDEWSVNKVRKAMAAKLREVSQKPYVSPGSMVWVRMPNSSGLEIGVVTDNPRISDRGQIVYDILCSGSVVAMTKGQIAKRNSKKYGG